MKIVVTGATSFVGLGAVRELLHRGHQVYAVLREHSTKADLLRENGKFPQGLTILEEDLGKLSKLPERIPGGCDVFLHMGWRGAGSDSRKNESVQEESVQDALNAVRVAKDLGCRRFLFTGSQAEYGVKRRRSASRPPRMDARNWQSGSRRKCSAGNWDWITGMHGFSARMDRVITRGRFFPPVSGSSGQGRR